VIDAAHKAGALAVVDNTFLSPALQRPIADFDADVVVHSTTKYINGHSDVVGGAVVAKEQAQHELLSWWANCLGLTGSPFDSFLTLRALPPGVCTRKTPAPGRGPAPPAVGVHYLAWLASAMRGAPAARLGDDFLRTRRRAAGREGVRGRLIISRWSNRGRGRAGGPPATMTHVAMSADAPRGGHRRGLRAVRARGRRTGGRHCRQCRPAAGARRPLARWRIAAARAV
jgi:cystathionine gamma-synthase